MIDLRLLRDDPEAVTEALARRGVERGEVEAVRRLDAEARRLLASQEELRAKVKALSRQVGEARKAGDATGAEELAAQSRRLGEEERRAAAEAQRAHEALRGALLVLPNLPADEAPDGDSPEDNVELDRWWPKKAEGAREPEAAPHQRRPHWEVGEELRILDLERGARLAGSMFPLFRGAGARLLRALSAFALERHVGAYEEIAPPLLVRRETMTSTGHLPKFEDDAYHHERDDLWAIPTAEVPLTSLHRGEILEEGDLPLRFTAATPCFRREAGAAGRDTRGLLRVHQFDKVELFAYATPVQARQVHDDIVARARALLEELGLTYRVLDLCCGDLGDQSARTFDLEVFAPGVGQWLEVSSVSWFRDYQARRANVRYRPAGGGPLAFVHTVNGSALAWARIWAALVEQGRREDGSVALPACLAPYLGGELEIRPA